MTFRADKAFTEQAEHALARWYSRHGLAVEFSEGKFSAWDLYVRGSVEIKHDRRAAATGNFFVEQSAHGQPSGISTSKATAWALVSGSAAFFIGTEKLRAILDTLPLRDGPDGKQGRILPIRFLESLPYVARADLSEFLS
jgi:hypothetical protein